MAGVVGITGTEGGIATPRQLNVCEYFLVTSFSDMSKDSLKPWPVIEYSYYRAVRSVPAKGSTVRLYTEIATHCLVVASIHLWIPSCSIFSFIVFLQKLYSVL